MSSMQVVGHIWHSVEVWDPEWAGAWVMAWGPVWVEAWDTVWDQVWVHAITWVSDNQVSIDMIQMEMA